MAESTEPSIESPRHATATPKSNARSPPPSTAAQQRLPAQGVISPLDPLPPRLYQRRRSSVLSFSSLDDAAQSFRNDILHPRTSDHKTEKDEHEVTNWHSSPLAFALLPAIAGLVFQNGSQFVTDALLLGLAAIFMNWSIRLPWDWYYSAQALRMDVQPFAGERVEDEIDHTAVDTDSAAESPRLGLTSEKFDSEEVPVTPQILVQRELAAKELRRQELLALTATFILPMGAAYLLHVIRAQLSRPSTGLVSDYNLSIFLLAAEVRPFRQLIRLMSSRTLHLQRTVTGLDNPFATAAAEKTLLGSLSSRLSELESRMSTESAQSANAARTQSSNVNDLTLEIRKRYEPRLEGLERAVRRYEKRSATLAMLTEQRLQALESRINDAVSLAAVAAQNSRSQGLVTWTFEKMSKALVIPAKLAFDLATWPFNLLEEMYMRMKGIVLGPVSTKRVKSTLTPREDASRSKAHAKKPGR